MQFYKILSIVFWISQLIYSQCDIISLTAKINSSNRFERIEAIDSILMCNLPEAVPYLENRILIEGDPSIALRLLFALDSLGSENILPISLELLSSFENGKFSDRGNNLINKIIIVDILFNNGSFSKSHLVLDFLNMYPDGYDPIILALLEKIIQKDSVLNQLAKQKIEEAVDKNISLTNKIIALKILSRNFGNEKTDFFKELILTNQDQSIRSVAIDCLLEINIPSSKEFLTNRLYLDSSETIRRKIARLLLSHWGTPSDYLTINEYRSLEPDGSVRKSIIDFIDFFRPPIHTDSINITIDNLLNVVNEIMIYTWLGDQTFSNELKNILTTAKTNLQNGDSLACRVQVKAFQDLVDNVYKDSLNTDPRFVTIEGWKFLYWNAQYILDRLPEPPANPNLLVNLKNSLGNQIPASNVKYYEGSWKDAVNNGDGTFTVITTKPTVSIRMFYEYANQTVHNITAHNNTYTFHTVNASVELRNSSGNLIDQGTVQYYAGAWRTFGTTQNGVAHKELLPINYSFRMTYEYVPLDKQQDISTNSTVTFSTVLCTVKVTKANGQPLSGAGTKYYSGAWRDIGLTNTNGEATKELLPKSLNFRATSGNVNKDKQQDIGLNSLVEIQLNVP